MLKGIRKSSRTICDEHRQESTGTAAVSTIALEMLETAPAIGAGVGGAAGLLAGLGLLAIPGLGPVLAAGWLTSTAVNRRAGSEPMHRLD
jgi:hypothetical protein